MEEAGAIVPGSGLLECVLDFGDERDPGGFLDRDTARASSYNPELSYRGGSPIKMPAAVLLSFGLGKGNSSRHIPRWHRRKEGAVRRCYQTTSFFGL